MMPCVLFLTIVVGLNKRLSTYANIIKLFCNIII